MENRRMFVGAGPRVCPEIDDARRNYICIPAAARILPANMGVFVTSSGVKLCPSGVIAAPFRAHLAPFGISIYTQKPPKNRIFALAIRNYHG